MSQNPSQLDKYDHAILSTLALEGRLSITDLAERVGLSKSPVQARLKKLEAQRYILGYHARLNNDLLGKSHVAFVQIKLNNTTAQALEAFNRAVKEIDYLLKVRTSDINSYRHALGESISSLPFVAHSSTFVSMSAVVDPQ
ncbi:MAG: winged helix-turn-helix transcriptional regulator [Granulosicoccaceae bacterium]